MLQDAPKTVPRRAKTANLAPNRRRNRGQDAPQDFKISRPNIDAENYENFNKKINDFGSDLWCFSALVSKMFLFFVDISTYSENAQKYYVFA